MKDKTQEICPNCGAQMKAWEQRMTPGLVRCLIKMVEAVHRLGKNDIHFLHDTGFNFSEGNNFKKLRYWGLVWHVDENNQRNGRWLVTAKGGRFLRGEIEVPVAIFTFRNKRVPYCDSERMVGIQDFRGKVPEFQSDWDYRIIEGKLGELKKEQAILL